jgi:outer membrane lipoprotein-sorting protein
MQALIEDRDSQAHGRALVNILRRLPLSRLLLLCALVVAIGVSATAIAFALGTGPTPPAKPLAQAVHDALSAPSVEGFSANVQLTDHLLEGANLASGSSGGGGSNSLTSNPLLTGADGRLWVAKDGRMRLELQSEEGDTQVIYDGQTLSVYDAASNTLYRIDVPTKQEAAEHKTSPDATSSGNSSQTTLTYVPEKDEVPSVAKIEEAISKLQHATLSGATPTDVAGQPAYTVRVSPKESGSLLGGAELSWDANNGVPLRAAIYSSASSSPVIELATSEVSFAPVASSVFEFTPPPNAKIEEVKLSKPHDAKPANGSAGDHPTVTTHGSGVTAVDVLESKAKRGEKPLELPEQLPKVKIGETNAAELSTALGTVLGFERSGVRYLLLGAVSPAQIEAVARGL